jgi:hypothetical protein
VEGDLGDFVWHRKHDVEIGHRQQIGLTVGKPAFARRTLALGTMGSVPAEGEMTP